MMNKIVPFVVLVFLGGLFLADAIANDSFRSPAGDMRASGIGAGGGTLSGPVCLEDNVELQLGTACGDSVLYFNGTDTYWLMQAGSLMIAPSGGAPPAADSPVHIWDGTAGARACAATSTVCLEDNTSSFMEFLSPNNGFGGIRFSDVAASLQGQLLYGNSNASVPDKFLFYADEVRVLDIGAGVMEHKQATTYSTTVDGLTISPAGVGTLGGATGVKVVFDDGDDDDTYIQSPNGTSDVIDFYTNGTLRFRIDQNGTMDSLSNNKPRINWATSATDNTPNIQKDRADADTGVGGATDDEICLIAGGTCSVKATTSGATITGDLVVTGSIGGFRGEMYDSQNTDAFVVNDQTTAHCYHTNGMTTDAASLLNWTQDDGGAGTPVSITAVADAGGGDITVTAATHGLAVGDIVSQTNMSVAAYDGVFDVLTVPTADTYTVTAVWSATATGTMDQCAYLLAPADGAGDYVLSWQASGASVGNNIVFDFVVYVEDTAQSKTEVRRKFGTGGDVGSFSGGGFLTIANDDKVTFTVSNATDSSNLTLRNLNVNLHKL